MSMNKQSEPEQSNVESESLNDQRPTKANYHGKIAYQKGFGIDFNEGSL